ncbi:hypothetical protein [Psychroserpens mesophilus]|uniref:hypothetical protein n=1 Tax=Psychroserpens mesophilus TaxID=325473 RepID=UPI003D6550E3
MSDKKGLKQKDLYDLVWSKPLTTLAKELNFDAYNLRKICKQHNIPLPQSGHWQKIKHNKKVSKTTFPIDVEKDKTTILYLDEKGYIAYNPPGKVKSKLKTEIETSKELSLKVPDKLSKPHKYIIATKEYHKAIKIRNKTRNWSMKIDDSDALSINVSDGLFSRALRFMDTLIKAMEKRGYIIKVSNHTTITVFEQSYDIRLSEKNRRVKRETNNSWDSFDLEPTGNLCLKLDDLYPKKEWSDTKTKPLEDKLADILVWIETRAKEDKARKIERAIWREEQEKLRKIEEDLQKVKDEELSNFKALLTMATRWHKAEYLRKFIKKLESNDLKLQSNNQPIKNTLEWAKEKADWYDPLIEKEVKLLEDIDRETLEVKRNKYW